METRKQVMEKMESQKMSLLNDDGKVLTFRKKFSIGWFIVLTMLGFGIVIYPLYHFALKQKVFMTYKK